jgi:LmbE family N-acetylglucosaminyl deacetylase
MTAGSPSFRALVVAAHPDDIEFGSAGTLATWVDQGAEVTYCLVTDGSTGTQDRSLVGQGLNEIRMAEAKEAADVIGAKGIEWLGYRDGYVEYSLELRKDIARVFRKTKPHRYMIMDPSPMVGGWFVNHPDHRAVGQASLDVTLTAGTTPGHFPELIDEGFEPWRGLRELWIASPEPGPVVVDVSMTLERKIQALLCHRSQVGDDTERISSWMRERAAAEGAPEGFRYGESFRVTRGPGFHPDELDDIDFEFPPLPLDPRSAPATKR